MYVVVVLALRSLILFLLSSFLLPQNLFRVCGSPFRFIFVFNMEQSSLHDLNVAKAAVALSDHDELHHEHLALRPILDILKLSEPRDLLSLPKDLIASAIEEARLPLDGAAAVHVALGKLHPAASGQHADTEHRTALALIRELIRKMPDPVDAQRAQDRHHLDLLARKDYPYKGDRERLLKFLHAASSFPDLLSTSVLFLSACPSFFSWVFC